HIHHADFDALNDRLENLVLLAAAEHNALHRSKMIGDNNPARRLMNPQWRQRIAAATRGAHNPRWGKPHAASAREKMRAASAHRAKLSASGRAAADPSQKRRAAQTGHRNAALRAARLLLDSGAAPSWENWDDLRGQAQELGARRTPGGAKLAGLFASEAEFQE